MTSIELTDLISVIVPIYKVEPYLDRCVQSIIDQTYKNLEIILVDDGSPDRCPAMCDTWKMQDNRIRVIHKINGGLSDARNAGLSVATGKYIAFVDSDDWLHVRFLEILFKAMHDSGSQLAACDIKETDTVCEAVPLDGDDKLTWDAYTRDEAMNFLAKGQKFRAVAWNKLYKKELLQNETFPIGKYHEDEFFTYKIIDKCDLLAYVDIPLYYYFQREGSIMAEFSFRHLDALEAFCERQAFFKNNYPSLSLPDKLMICETCINMYSNFPNRKTVERKTAKKKVFNYRRCVRFSVNELHKCSLKQIIYVFGSIPVLIGLSSRLHKLNKRRNNELHEKSYQ